MRVKRVRRRLREKRKREGNQPTICKTPPIWARKVFLHFCMFGRALGLGGKCVCVACLVLAGVAAFPSPPSLFSTRSLFVTREMYGTSKNRSETPARMCVARVCWVSHHLFWSRQQQQQTTPAHKKHKQSDSTLAPLSKNSAFSPTELVPYLFRMH